jgi:hypothetical protein
MTTSYTPNAALGKPASGDRTWNVVVNANADVLDAVNAIGDLAVTLHETPSTSLNVSVSSGLYSQQDGTVGTYAGTASQAIAASSTKVLYLDLTAAGALTVAAAFPTTAHVRLATVVTGTSTITSIADARVVTSVVGSIVDGTAIALGTTSGLKIGTASTQKLGFLGATPAVQATGGVLTAGASYTATEQGMLQKAYNALRTFGLLS